MATCPKCQRNSLEFSEVRKAAWCLYADCGFTKNVANYNDYLLEFEADRMTKAPRHATKQPEIAK